jgi:hypothetical protein
MVIVSESRHNRDDRCTHPVSVYRFPSRRRWCKSIALRVVRPLVVPRASTEYLIWLAKDEPLSKVSIRTIDRSVIVQHLEDCTPVSEHDMEERLGTDAKVLCKNRVSHVLWPV